MVDESGAAAISMRIEGRVQGVGFRYFTYRAAMTFGLRGWVKNAGDGSVRILVIGAPVDIDQFRDKVRQGPAFSRVEHLLEETAEAEEAGRWDSFRILYE